MKNNDFAPITLKTELEIKMARLIIQKSRPTSLELRGRNCSVSCGDEVWVADENGDKWMRGKLVRQVEPGDDMSESEAALKKLFGTRVPVGGIVEDYIWFRLGWFASSLALEFSIVGKAPNSKAGQFAGLALT